MTHSSTVYPRRRVSIDCGENLITKQAHKDECDIHKILKQYKKTGIITHITQRQALYADLPSSMDYQEAIETMRTAQESFSELPSSVRERFGNDPFNLLAALGDPNMKAELQELGILTAPPKDLKIQSGEPPAA